MDRDDYNGKHSKFWAYTVLAVGASMGMCWLLYVVLFL